ncbi:MAG: hypothetical protein JWP12_262 [Bacteroidetes bacterium]|nr:hypothetical protein [Bacteroidota bacterium]
MKKIITLFSFTLLFFFSSSLSAQSPHPFELGFNGGVSWLKSDVKMKKLGAGFGFTFGQTYCMNATSPLLWGWRFRYLYANTYGQDYKPAYGLKNNTALNGETDPALDYAHTNGFVYQNYKTHLDELSLELLIGANKLRERTGFYPYIFGGLGLTKAVAKTDQLNDKNQRYNYAAIDSTGTASKSEIRTRLNNMSDGSYETLADGNQNPRWKFMPSLGIGLGFEIVKGVSIGIEHKMTWGLNDVLDGQRWSATNTPTGNNDMYHYTSVWLKFGFGRAAKNTSLHNTTPVITYIPAPLPLPVIMFTNPDVPNAVTNQPTIAVTGTIINIASGNEMSITANGYAVPGFTYNSETKVFSFIAPLQNGGNTFVVSASNPSGTVNASTTVIFEQPVILVPVPANQPPLPVVIIAEPAQNPYVTAEGGVAIRGTIEHILNKSQIHATVNGEPVPGLSYNAPTHSFVINSGLMPGANTFVITATNNVGDDTKATTVIFQQSAGIYNAPKPEVRMVYPAANPYNTNMNAVNVLATVHNVESRNAITLIVNGYPNSGFTYDLSNGNLNFAMNLVNGANTIQIQAVNEAGTDSKTETIIYTPVVVEPKPQITITNPAGDPYTTSTNAQAIAATVLNVTAVTDIAVTLNGATLPVHALSFNAALHKLTFNVNLIVGANMITIKASNASGIDSKTETVIYSVPEAAPKPVITITNPTANPYTTISNSETVNATVLNVTSGSQISATINGTMAPMGAVSYNTTSHQLTVHANLIAGANSIAISATNASGSDSQTQTIVYSKPGGLAKPVVTIINPNANPAYLTTAVTTMDASVLNITSVSQIAVTQNGTAIPATALNFNAAGHAVSFNVTLVNGANTIVVKATNTMDSDSKSETIIYSLPVLMSRPLITMINPPTNPYTSGSGAIAISASVINVTAASGITVFLNGNTIPASDWNYNLSTNELTFNVNLISGSNAVKIVAANTSGSASKMQTIDYTAPVMVSRPIITMVNPVSNPFTTSLATLLLQATVTEIADASNITVMVNGAALPAGDINYNSATHELKVNLNLTAGSNSLRITASNTTGNSFKILSVTRTTAAAPTHVTAPTTTPLVTPGTVTHPGRSTEIKAAEGKGTTGAMPAIALETPASVSTTDATYTITATTTNVASGGITVKINGTAFTGFLFNSRMGALTIPVTLNAGANVVVIEVTNTLGKDTKTITITKN